MGFTPLINLLALLPFALLTFAFCPAILPPTIGDQREENLSTQAIAPQARARLLDPHAQRGRKESAPTSPPEGAVPAHRLAPALAVQRLRRKRDLDSVFAHGSRQSHSGLTLRALPVTDSQVVRLAVTMSGKLGKAVVRNRLRRRIREACRLTLKLGQPGQGWDLVILARAEAVNLDWGQIRAAVTQVLTRAGVILP